MSTPAKTHYRSDYQASNYLVDTVELTIELDEQCTRVRNVMRLARNPALPAADNDLFLNGEALALLSVSVDGKALAEADYQLDDDGLRLTGLPDQCELCIESSCCPIENTELSGLYQSNSLFCTQCESEGFRRITYYLDRPDVLATFTTKIIAPRDYQTLLSNGNLIEKGELDAEPEMPARHYAIWHDPFKKPCYLFALVAGNFACLEDEFTTCSGRAIRLQIFVEPVNEQKTAHAMWSLKQAMRWDEVHYGREYDLDIFMIVAVDDFNFGAMENKGLNVFNSKYILADPATATDQDYQNIAAVVAHEYFHNWSGNRVTCRDWFQLSLKEGLTVFRDQSFSETVFDADVSRIKEVTQLRVGQFAEDAGPMAHPIRPDSYEQINNFYTMTVYEKGAEIIRMQYHILGAEAFRRGTDLYFERHDGQAVTCDDFVAALETASDVDLTQFKHWYSQAGTPEVSVQMQQDLQAQTVTLTLSQSCPPTPKQAEKPAFHIPVRVALLDEQGQSVPLQLQGEAGPEGDDRVLALTAPQQSYVFEGVSGTVVPSLLRGFSAPVKLQYDYDEQALAFLMQHEDNGFNRFEAAFQFLSQTLLTGVNAHQQGQTMPAPSLALLTALAAQVKNDALDRRLLAQILSLPSENYLAEQGDCVAVEAIHASYTHLQVAIAEALREPFCKQAVLTSPSPYQFDAAGMGERAFTGVCLHYLARLGGAEFEQHCARCFAKADNMTAQMQLLSALNATESAVRDELFTAFDTRWRHEPLVMDKWFMLQASATRATTVETVTELLSHPSFSLNNPNKVYALLVSFGRNLSQFHRQDGQGYDLLTAQIERLNALNPQVAARVLTPLTQWRRFDEARQQKLYACLERLLALPNLSKQLHEVIGKSLA